MTWSRGKTKYGFSIWQRSKRPPFAWPCFSPRMCFSNLVSAWGAFFAFHQPSWKCSLQKRGCIACYLLLVCQCAPVEGNDSVLRQIHICRSLAHVSKLKFLLKCIINAANVMLWWFYLLRNQIFKKLSRSACFLTQLILDCMFCGLKCL